MKAKTLLTFFIVFKGTIFSVSNAQEIKYPERKIRLHASDETAKVLSTLEPRIMEEELKNKFSSESDAVFNKSVRQKLLNRLALKGNLEGIKVLEKFSIDLNYSPFNSILNAFELPPAAWAVRGRKFDVARYLIEKGAKADTSDKLYSLGVSSTNVLTNEREDDESTTLLHDAMWRATSTAKKDSKYTDFVIFLISQGASITATDGNGQTAFEAPMDRAGIGAAYKETIKELESELKTLMRKYNISTSVAARMLKVELVEEKDSTEFRDQVKITDLSSLDNLSEFEKRIVFFMMEKNKELPLKIALSIYRNILNLYGNLDSVELIKYFAFALTLDSKSEVNNEGRSQQDYIKSETSEKNYKQGAVVK